jgi:hypothetical protein
MMHDVAGCQCVLACRVWKQIRRRLENSARMYVFISLSAVEVWACVPVERTRGCFQDVYQSDVMFVPHLRTEMGVKIRAITKHYSFLPRPPLYSIILAP